MNAVGEDISLETTHHVTPAMQDYLKAVYRTRDEAGTATVQRLAAELGVSSPSVTNMVKRLAELGLLEYARYQGVALTGAGERVAVEVTRHHRLLEQFLVETLGYSWDEVHLEAERLEHHISEAMEARIDARLGHPERDPHGDPIPSEDGTVPEVDDRQLVELRPGERAAIVRVPDRDAARLRYLATLGLIPGAVVTLLNVQPFDGPLWIRIHDTATTDTVEHHLGRELARTIYVGSDR
ncbi:MAG: metal-dependent transcriptional regulator [Thermomicrobiales bacterium]